MASILVFDVAAKRLICRDGTVLNVALFLDQTLDLLGIFCSDNPLLPNFSNQPSTGADLLEMAKLSLSLSEAHLGLEPHKSSLMVTLPLC